MPKRRSVAPRLVQKLNPIFGAHIGLPRRHARGFMPRSTPGCNNHMLVTTVELTAGGH